MATRKLITIRVPEELLSAIDDYCQRTGATRTNVFLIGAKKFVGYNHDVKKRKKPKRWIGSVDDMPMDW